MNTNYNFNENNKFLRELEIASWAKAENMEQCTPQSELWNTRFLRVNEGLRNSASFSHIYSLRRSIAQVLHKLAYAIEPKTIPASV